MIPITFSNKYTEEDILPYQDLLAVIDIACKKNKTYGTAIALLYSTAARCSEVLGSQRTFLRDPPAKWSHEKDKWIKPLKYKTTTKVDALTYKNINYNPEKACLEITLHIAKKKKKKRFFRTAVIFAEKEGWLFGTIVGYAFKTDGATFVKKGKDTDRVFPITYTQLEHFFNYYIMPQIQLKIKKPIGLHWLRHSRLTHYGNCFGYNNEQISQLVQFDLSTSQIYVHQDNKNLYDKMLTSSFASQN